MRILDFVINVEQAEQDLYRRLAECSGDDAIRSVFQTVATKERILLQKLQQLKDDPSNNSLQLRKERPPTQVRKNRAGSCELLDDYGIRNDLGSYNYILQTEQMVFNLYVNLKKRESDPEAHALFDLILDEKQLEIDRIHTLYDVARVVH